VPTIPRPSDAADASDACATDLTDAGFGIEGVEGVSFSADGQCYSIFPNEAIYRKAAAGTSCNTTSHDGTLLGNFDEEATSALAHFEGITGVTGRGKPIMADGGPTANAKFTGGAVSGCDGGSSVTLVVLDKDVTRPTGTIAEENMGCNIMMRLYIKNCNPDVHARYGDHVVATRAVRRRL